MYNYNLNHDFTLLKQFENKSIRPKYFLRPFLGNYLFYEEFINTIWLNFIDRKMAMSFKLILAFWFLILNFLLALVSIFITIAIMVNYLSVKEQIGDIGIIMSCLSLPVIIIILQPLYILIAKKQIIRSYKKNYFITGTKELKEITYNRLLITDKKKWVSDIFGLFKKENQIEGSKASDNLSPNPNVEIIITKESAIEKEMYSQNTKDLSTFLIILRPISWIISIAIKPVFLMNKLLFVKEILQQYGLKIKLQKYIVINWLFFLVLFIAPIITITFLISFGVINNLLWSILPYFIIAIAYALMVAILKYYLTKNAIIKEL